MFNLLARLFSPHTSYYETQKKYIEAYLSESVSLEDLERRQRELKEKGYLA